MKRLIPIISALLLTVTVWAQSPEKLSYQAVVRNTEGELVVSQEVSMQISILAESIYGASVYVETQTATTNENGLVCVEIGSEDAVVLNGVFSDIDWSAGKYLIKTETDPEGGSNYSITGTSQLLSVPYALYAKTAESVIGGASETDPEFTASAAANINADDITNLGNLSGINTGDQDLSLLATKTALIDTAAAIRASIGTTSGSTSGIETESDPIFSASEAANITSADITKLGNLSGINSGDQDLSTYAKKTDVLTKTNTTAFTPDADYEPATKKYVDDAAGGTYAIGDTVFGGIVFWVDESAKHGLVCAKEDQSTAARWYGGTTGNTRALGDGAFSGAGNTFIIIAATAALGDDGETYAARICNELQETKGSSVYGGWYLPSSIELQLMYENTSAINTAAATIGGSDFGASSYWSSTEVTFNSAKAVDFSSGAESEQSKANTHGVRAVRAF